MKICALQQIREKEGVTCEKIALSLGVSKQYYWQIENGKRRLYYEMAVKISRFFNLEQTIFF